MALGRKCLSVGPEPRLCLNFFPSAISVPVRSNGEDEAVSQRCALSDHATFTSGSAGPSGCPQWGRSSLMDSPYQPSWGGTSWLGSSYPSGISGTLVAARFHKLVPPIIYNLLICMASMSARWWVVWFCKLLVGGSIPSAGTSPSIRRRPLPSIFGLMPRTQPAAQPDPPHRQPQVEAAPEMLAVSAPVAHHFQRQLAFSSCDGLFQQLP